MSPYPNRYPRSSPASHDIPSRHLDHSGRLLRSVRFRWFGHRTGTERLSERLLIGPDTEARRRVRIPASRPKKSKENQSPQNLTLAVSERFERFRRSGQFPHSWFFLGFYWVRIRTHFRTRSLSHLT